MLGAWSVLIPVVLVLVLTYTVFNFYFVKRLSEGTDSMKKIASAIRQGAGAFIKYEYRILLIAIAVISLIFIGIYQLECGIAFLMGSLLSASTGLIGMRAATYGNVRVTNTARETKSIGQTLSVALRTGSIMGKTVNAFGILGLFVLFVLYSGRPEMLTSFQNKIGLEYVPFSMILTSYALGCSTVAIFMRVGGGIFTKAADMGADLVGKVAENIPEDDPRNAGVIADSVGDNVNDVCGMGSDLMESFVASVVSAIVLAIHTALSASGKGAPIAQKTINSMITYPLAFATVGLLSCAIALFICLRKKMGENPHKELNIATWLSAGLTVGINLIVTICMFAGKPLAGTGFNLGFISPWLSAIIGNASGIAIGMISEYYTSAEKAPTKTIVKASLRGPALNITQGSSVGMKSCLLPVMVMAFAFLISSSIAGFYGIALAAAGMLSYVGMTVAVDSYGPVSDNAGGIAEMAKLPKEVRAITDELDAVGNTTAAIGKGFAIGSAALATLGLITSYMYSFIPVTQELSLNIIDKFVFAGLLVGTAIPWFFSGLLIDSVSTVAMKMVDEIKRQFNEIRGLREGNADPDYAKCVGIATKGALHEMKIPSMMAIGIPIIAGFIFGANFVAGMLIGSTLSAIGMAIYTGNAGGAWDNAKKAIESGELKGHGKGSQAHAAAVVGDTYGDPLKDTVGPCQDIFIKIEAVVAGIAVVLFTKWNLVAFLSNLFK